MLSFGEELKRLAEAKGFLTQKLLAEASGVSQQTVAALYLNKSPNVSAVILGKLSKALGVSCDALMPFLIQDEEGSITPPVTVKKTASKKKSKQEK